jgi:hypothetical protein
MQSVRHDQILVSISTENPEAFIEDVLAKIEAGDLDIEDAEAILNRSPEKKLRSISAKVIVGKIEPSSKSVTSAHDWIEKCKDIVDPGDVTTVPTDIFFKSGGVDELTEQVVEFLREVGVSIEPADRDLCNESGMVMESCEFHNDMVSYSERIFCVTWLSEDLQLDLVFPQINVQVPLTLGSTVLFDPCQPHGVIRRGSVGHLECEFVGAPRNACFSFDIPINAPGLVDLMEIRCFDERVIWSGIKIYPNDEVGEIDASSGGWTL